MSDGDQRCLFSQLVRYYASMICPFCTKSTPPRTISQVCPKTYYDLACSAALDFTAGKRKGSLRPPLIAFQRP